MRDINFYIFNNFAIDKKRLIWPIYHWFQLAAHSIILIFSMSFISTYENNVISKV